MPFGGEEQRGGVFFSPLSCVSYSTAIWSLCVLSALLQRTKPYCGFTEISRDGERRRGGGRGVETITRGARPISSIFSREHASIPKDSGSQSFYAPLPNFCSYRRRRRGDLCHGNPILPPPRVSSVCLGELKIGGERLLGLLICLQNRGGLLDWLNALVSVWASILCVCLYGTSLRRRSEPGPHLQRMRSRKDSLRGGGINWFSEISRYFTHCCLVYRDGKICE